MSSDLLLSTGSDQMANQFDIKFPTGIPGGGDAERIAIRMDQSFDPPEESFGTYEIAYRGIKIKKPSMNEETDKTLTMEFRLDQNWYVYKDLKQWKELIFDPETHIGLNDNLVRTTCMVPCYGRNNEVVQAIMFKGVCITNLKLGSLDPTSAEPVRVSATFSFYSMKTVDV